MSGIRTLNDILLRCVVDEHGCWIWGAGKLSNGVPHCWLPPGVIGAGRCSMSARRASWALAGRVPHLRPKLAIYPGCGVPLCCNPRHLKAGRTGDAMRAAQLARGSFSRPDRLVRLAKFLDQRTTPAEVVRAVAADIEAGMTAKEAAKRHGIRYAIAKTIRRGEHAHQRQKTLPGATVFSWRPPLAEAA